jgi:ABC-type multidrug transport system fused ATPase/permease subunit
MHVQDDAEEDDSVVTEEGTPLVSLESLDSRRSTCSVVLSMALFGGVLLMLLGVYTWIVGGWLHGPRRTSPCGPQGFTILTKQDYLTDCAYYLGGLIPINILFLLALVWTFLGLPPFNQTDEELAEPALGVSRNWKIRLLLAGKLVSLLWALVYPIVQKVVFHIASKGPGNYHGPLVVSFFLRQSGLLVTIFAAGRNMLRGHRDGYGLRLYEGSLLPMYLLSFAQPLPSSAGELYLQIGTGLPLALLLVLCLYFDRIFVALAKTDNGVERPGDFQELQQAEHATHDPELVVPASRSAGLPGMSVVLLAWALLRRFGGKRLWGIGGLGILQIVLSVVAAIGYAYFEMLTLSTQGVILGGPADGANVTAAATSSPVPTPASAAAYAQTTSPVTTTPAATTAPSSWPISSTMLTYATFMSLQSLCQALQHVSSGAVRQILSALIRPRLMRLLLPANDPATASYILQQQCPTLEDRIDDLLMNLFTPLCQLAFAFAFLSQLSGPLTGVLLGASTVYILIVFGKIFVVAWLSDKRESENAAIAAALTATLSTGRDTYSVAVGEGFYRYMRLLMWEGVCAAMDLLSNGFVIVSAYWFGAILTTASDNPLSQQDFVSFALIAQTFVVALNLCASALTEFTHSYATMVQVARVLECGPAALPHPEGMSIRAFMNQLAESLEEDSSPPSDLSLKLPAALAALRNVIRDPPPARASPVPMPRMN